MAWEKFMENVKAMGPGLPFDAGRLDALLDAEGIDAIVVTSKHNIQYLLGGYRFFFFETMEAIGVTRYLPALIYRKGRPDQAGYIGCDIEKNEQELGRFWTPHLDLAAVGTKDAMARAAVYLRTLGPGIRRVGVEPPFLPSDADRVLREKLPDVALVDAVVPLERLRAVKSAEEIGHLREASERVVGAMMTVFSTHCVPGATKREVTEALRREEVARDLVFDYNQITAGASLNRAPSDQKLAAGDIVSLDSGGNYKGYIGDLCRMAILGEPDAELVDLLAFVEEVQQAARRPIHQGARGGDIADAALPLISASPHKTYTHFIVHGMGLVSHEAPRLMNEPRFSYSGDDAEYALQAGMCLSVETTMRHPKRGFVKLEDTVLVTPEGWEGLGERGRGWNRAGGT
jgi:Xaa-Pro aminopeptidase